MDFKKIFSVNNFVLEGEVILVMLVIFKELR